MDATIVVCDDLTDSTGFDGSATPGLTVTTTGMAVLNNSNPALDSALLLSDDNTVTIGTDATVTVMGRNGFRIRALNDNFVNNQGTINVLGPDGRAMSIMDNTTGVLPNGAINSGTITVTGDRGFALETGANSGVANTGIINLDGDMTRGISAADRTDFAIASDVTNQGTINVSGNNAYGIKAGDGWVKGLIVGEPALSAPGVRNQAGATINVTGNNSFGIFVGDEANSSNNNSFVLNRGLIDVIGTDSIGVSVGGNDLLNRFNAQSGNPISVLSMDNSGTIMGGPNAGPLVEFRTFVSGKENVLQNSAAGRILADNANAGSVDRFVAIRGSAGDELILNLGEIQGDIELGDGDDRFVNFAGSTFTGSILGGSGDDLVILAQNSIGMETFDTSSLVDIETLEVGGGTFGWELINSGAAFTGLTEVAAQGLLRVPNSVTLGGDFSVDQTGRIEVDLDPATTLTVEGMSRLNGMLIPTHAASLLPGPTQFRVIAANGGYTGRFQNRLAIGLDLYTATYDTAGVLVQYTDEGFVAVAQGSSQRAIAQHLSDIMVVGSTSPELQNLLDEFETSTGTLANVYQAFSPEIYDAQTTVVVEGGRRVANLLFDRPRDCKTGEVATWPGIDAKLPCHSRSWSPWLAAIGGVRRRDGFGDHPRYDAQLGGLAVGVDLRPIENLDLTFAISSQRGTVDGSGYGKSTITLTDLSAYAAWNQGPLRVQGTVGWGHGFHQNRRNIRFTEEGLIPVDVRGISDQDSDRISVAGEIGYVFEVGSVKIEPIGGIDWAWVDQRPINEDETAGFGVRIGSRDDSVGSINGGLRISAIYLHSKFLVQNLLWMDGVWKPSIDIRWRQMLAGYKRDINARLQGAPDAVADFTVKGKEDPGGVEIGGGISFSPKHANRLQFDLRYEAFVASHTVSHDLIARAQIGF